MDPDVLEKIEAVRLRAHAEVLALLPAGYRVDAVQVEVLLHDARFAEQLRRLALREEWLPDAHEDSRWFSSRCNQEERHTGAVALFV